MRLAIAYTLFAILAIATNLGMQKLCLWCFPSFFEPWFAMAAGTGVGLVLKYVLDKLFIFDAGHLRKTSEVAKSFWLYTLSGGFTTLLFWGAELAFIHFYPGWSAAPYVGGGLGLAAGYAIKYRLDRRYAFA